MVDFTHVKNKLNKTRDTTKNMWSFLVQKFTTNVTYFLFLEAIIFIAIFLIIYSWNPLNVAMYYPAGVKLFLLMIIFVMICAPYFIEWRSYTYDLPNSSPPPRTKSPAQKEKKNKHPILFYIKSSFVFIIFFVALMYWINYVTSGLMWGLPKFPTILNIFGNILFVVLFIDGLSILYLLLEPFFKNNKNKYIELIKNTIFYIPCILVNTVNAIKHEYKITTKPIWILLAAEILFITLYFLVPFIKSYIGMYRGTELLKNPAYLDYATALGPFQGITPKELKKGKKFNYNYSVSAWFRLNPQPPNTKPSYNKYTNILTFGNKPRIEFNGKNNTFRIRTDLGNGKQALIYETQKFSYQKWNNIVVNYSGGTMDIFLNGNLVASHPDIAPYMRSDSVIAGEDYGLEGGICNVVYYDKILLRREILSNYGLLKNKNPPTY